MGYLKKLFQRFRSRAGIQLLPSGSMTVDRDGSVIVTTVSSTYPRDLLHEIGSHVLSLFREAYAAQVPLTEISLHYGSFRITARELRGGAIIFLTPQTAHSQNDKIKL